jgi:CubicO group peptidase (beta-lactamase class C family)
MTVSQYVSESWWGAMGAEADASWSTDSFYNRFEKLESGFNARPIDFARFGLMFANEGVVDGEQVVPRAWVEEATARTNVSLGDAAWLDQRYGYFWWVLPDGRFYAQGNLGQYVLVSPDDDVVIVRMGRDGRMSNGASLDWVSLLLEVTDRLSGSGPAGPEKAPGQKP